LQNWCNSIHFKFVQVVSSNKYSVPILMEVKHVASGETSALCAAQMSCMHAAGWCKLQFVQLSPVGFPSGIIR